MKNHTPGPWSVLNSSVIADSIKYSNNRSNKICDIESTSTPHLERLANAYLISASPDLLAALKELVIRCDGEEGVTEDGSNIQTIQAHAAIAKAEGKLK